MFFYKRNTENEKKVWHHWFAWYPVNVFITQDGDSKFIWFNTVWRCGKYDCWVEGCWWNWRYKEIKQNRRS